MTTKHLDEHLLTQSLDSTIDEQDELAVVSHLDDCPECQRRLEELASGGSAWSRIDHALRGDAESVRSSGTLSSLIPSEAADAPVYPSQYAQRPADFAVSFLEPSPRQDAIGRLGEFEILSVIGSGGMGIVLKGFQSELNRPVAVKVLAPHLATSGAARLRFLREAQATAAIVHPNVMPVLSVSEQSSLPFLVMPYVACHSLQQRIDADGPLPVVDVLRIGLQVAQALAAAHAQGLVHRDVKPANILLERGVDRVMLTDFGLARAVDDASVTRSGVIAGTPQYMSPEQARGETVDARSDLFSLGSVIYAMCTGRPPFRADTSFGILRKITDGIHRPLRELQPEIPAWLDLFMTRLLAKDASGRYESAQETAALLEQCLAHVQQPILTQLPESLRQSSTTPFKRWALGACCLLCFIIGSIVFLLMRPPNTKPQFPAMQQSPTPLESKASPTGHAWHDELNSEIVDLQAETDAFLRRVDQASSF